jgi:hypothetical protein
MPGLMNTITATAILPGQGPVMPTEARLGVTLESVAGGLTADAYVIETKWVQFTAAGDGSALLPPSRVGLSVVVRNDSTDVVDVFPSPGENINELAPDTAFSVTAGKEAIFRCYLAGSWTVALSN